MKKNIILIIISVLLIIIASSLLEAYLYTIFINKCLSLIFFLEINTAIINPICIFGFCCLNKLNIFFIFDMYNFFKRIFNK